MCTALIEQSALWKGVTLMMKDEIARQIAVLSMAEKEQVNALLAALLQRHPPAPVLPVSTEPNDR